MNINLQCPINQLGYGVAGLNILKALQTKHNVALHMIGQPQVTNQTDAISVERGLETAQTFDPQAPCVKIWHQNQMAERVGSGKFIGFPIFELDTFTDLEKHHLRSCDEWMVCSNWAKDIIQSSVSFKPTHVVPLGVDTEIFKPTPVRQDDKTIFFNCGKWEIRKGHDILIQAFKKLAEEHDNVELWMMCSNPFNSEKENVKWHKLYNHPKVRIIPRAKTHEQVYNIMSQVDCGVFPSRGEGWNLELLEMMAVGKHVIATEYSAHTEFCTEENCYPLPISDVEPAFDGKWFFGQGNWAEIGRNETEMLYKQMKMYLRLSHRNINEAGIETAKKFSWQNTAREITKCLKN